MDAESGSKNKVEQEKKRPIYLVVEVDKGWSWIICISVLVWCIIIGGMLKLTGVLFVEYAELYMKGTTATSWITFTLGIFMTVISPFGGYLSDNIPLGKMRVVIGVLGALATLFVAVSGFLPNLELTIVFYGALLGTCVALIDPTALSLPGRYFDKKRTTAYGIAMLGNAIGSLIMPIMFTGSISYCGFRGAMLIYAGIWLQSLFLCATAWPLSPKPNSSDQKEAPDGGLPSSENIIENKTSEKQELEKNGTQSTFSPEMGGYHGSRDSIYQQIKDDRKFSDEHKAGDKVLKRNLEDHQNLGFVGDSEKLESHGLSKKPSISNEIVEDPNTNTNQGVCQGILMMLKGYGRFLATPDLPLLLLALFLGIFAYLNQFFVLPPLVQELGISKVTGSLMITVCSAVEIVNKLVIGVLVDKYHISKALILIVCFTITGAVGLICSFFLNIYVLFVYVTILGLFGSTVVVLAIPMMIDIVDDDRKGAASGMFPFLSGLATALGPVILGAVGESFGSFSHSFRACAVAYLLSILVFLGPVLKNRFCHKESFDINKAPQIYSIDVENEKAKVDSKYDENSQSTKM